MGRADIRGDLYSLGAVLYHMLAGRPPYQGRDALELLHKHRTEPLWPVRDLAQEEITTEVEAIVQGLLEKDASHRIQTPRELIACIDAVVKPNLVGEKEESKAGQTLVLTTREMMAVRQNRTIMACDDQAYNVSMFNEILRRLGFNALTTRDGRAALGALGEREVDLVLTDTKLPGLSGESLLKEITTRYPRVPIILTRGGRQAAFLKRNYAMNVAGIVERPLDAYNIREHVLDALS